MKLSNGRKIWMTAVCTFALSAAACCWVFSGVSIYNVPVINNIAEAFYDGGAAGGSAITGRGEGGRPVIVIDAGHGGIDGGASSADGAVEKDLTLSIAGELKKVASEYPVKIIMTRTGDGGLYTDDDRAIRTKKREDLLRRKEIIEDSRADIAISIHLNSFPQDALVYGAQVFYPAEHEPRTNVRSGERTSKQFAQSVQKALEINIPDGRERVAMTKDDILLFKDISADIILVECGFLSNKNEVDLLKTAEYQHLLAESIWQGINEILCLKKTQEIQIIYSTNKIT